MEKIYTMMAMFFTGMYDRDESEDVGAGLVEYALLVSLIALIAIGAVSGVGARVVQIFTDIAAGI